MENIAKTVWPDGLIICSIFGKFTTVYLQIPISINIPKQVISEKYYIKP